jgi:hypothetical protein
VPYREAATMGGDVAHLGHRTFCDAGAAEEDAVEPGAQRDGPALRASRPCDHPAFYLVSCPRSSSHCAADFGGKQATENKELVALIWSSPDTANFRFGPLGSGKAIK